MMPGTVLVTGGAGFLGSHLCDALLARGHHVVAVDNLCTGSLDNLTDACRHERFRFVHHDIVDPFPPDLLAGGPHLVAVCNLASPASPTAYRRLAIETLLVGSAGMHHVLELARAHGARVLQASTSEVYGDPLEHPQRESYLGNVNPVGSRSMYDESKRFAEALCASYERVHGVDVRIARIFNTYGPRLGVSDGRVVSNLISEALSGAALTVHGTGTQTRSLCYVDDMIRGLMALLDSDVRGPVNLGSDQEHPIADLAQAIRSLAAPTASIAYGVRDVEDPSRRRPDLTRAHCELGWLPEVTLEEGLRRTIAWYAARWRRITGVTDNVQC